MLTTFNEASMNLRKEFNAALRATGSRASISRIKPPSTIPSFTAALREGISAASGAIAPHRISATDSGSLKNTLSEQLFS
ncbi:MAG: hypothetical protein RMI78_01910 [Nitrososphaerota archaeon]|nr:hypothetical protein [Nitrososphaerota archaeon]